MVGVLFLGRPTMAARTFRDAEKFTDIAVGKTFITQTDVNSYLGILANQAFTLVGTIFFLLMFYAGFLWFTAHGGEDQIEKAKKILFASIIGLTIIVGAYAMTNFIIPAAINIGTAN
jgi:hypothetical protein